MAEGIRKINEYVMQDGRTIIATDERIHFSNFVDGTPIIDSAGNIKVKKQGQDNWTNFSPNNIFLNKSITYNFIADKTLTNQQIANNTILNSNIKDLEINTSKIANNAINTDKLLDLSVTNEKILDGTIQNSKLEPKTILGSKIADNNIGTSHLMNACITESKIAIDAITTRTIKNRSVTSPKIETLNILTEHYAEASITTSKIANAQITTAKIGANQITTGLLADICVTTAKIADLQITSLKLASSSVITDKIANLAVDSNKLADGAVVTNKIGNSQITAEKLASSLNDAISRSIKLEPSTGIANVAGNLWVAKNINADGTITAQKIYNAVYNDLAEGYIPGEKLFPGQIVEVREDGKVYMAKALSNAIVGVISNEYAACYGATEEEILTGEKVAVGLIGKVHVNVFGPVKAGDRIVCTGNGNGAVSHGYSQYGSIGKAIETSIGDGMHSVLCLIFPN